DQIDYELDLVQALEIGHFRRIAGLYQRVKPGLYQRRETSAQHRLLAEEIGFSLFFKGRFQDAGAAPAYTRRVSQPNLPRIPRGILMYREQTGNAASLGEFISLQMARGFGRYHEHVDRFRRDDLLIMNGEPMREGQVVTGQKIWSDLFVIDPGSFLVRDQHHHDIAVKGGFGRILNYKAGGLSLCARGTARSETHDAIAARILEIIRVRVPLCSISDDRDLLALQIA